jgi:hypothetical protein
MSIFRLLFAGSLLVSSLFAVVPAQAQDEAEGGESRPVTPLDLQADDRVASGKASFMQGKTDAQGVRFSVGELDILQPVSVAVYTRTADDDVHLQIFKDGMQTPVREARTGSGRVAEFHFRTFDSFNIRVAAENPTDYQLRVWVGEPLQEDPPSIAVPASEYREGAAGTAQGHATDQADADISGETRGGISLSYLELCLIVALLLVIGVVVVLLLRRKSS